MAPADASPAARPLSTADLARRARAIEWLLLDVDGVMTDGRLHYTAAGEEVKVFHVRDGYGIKWARRAGLKVGILSGRESGALARRAADLEVDALIQGRDDKGPAFDGFLAAQATTPDRVAYVGDDVLDLPVIERVALSFAPADAVAAVRRRVDRVLAAAGGAGAVREAVELLLAARREEETCAR
jgi:3-deoxy-D-manno-octulosonate 8-phosphate phosphatase (KDO 8-P phosphatase)